MGRKIENTYSPLLPVVVIDAGHGGIDAGVRGISTGAKESDVNLEIAQFLRGFFVSAGFRCVMTRTTTGGLYGVFSKGFKMRDMQKRKEIILSANASLVVSVHQNFCPLPSRRGAQVFYNGEREGGKALADCIQGSLNDMDECVKKTSALAGTIICSSARARRRWMLSAGFCLMPTTKGF
jgi:N-acetylmuramoyl-L-alanine amidase